jgi:predicted PP-loop superfamily ATPase
MKKTLMYPPVVDPTENVKLTVAAATLRQDDLREAEVRRQDDLREAERVRVDQQMTLRADYDAKLAVAEAKRIDAIRAVDVAAVAVANERATAQAAVLAAQVSQSAETLRTLVAATAQTVAQQLQTVSTGIGDRLSALEKSSYEGKGSGTGMRDMWGWIFGGFMTFVVAAAAAYAALHK